MKMRSVVLSGGIMIAAVSSAASRVVTWSQPAEVPRSSDYRLKVNGKPVEVIAVPKPEHTLNNPKLCDPDKVCHPYSVAWLDGEGELEVVVESDNLNLMNTRILPLRQGIKPKIHSPRKISFRAKAPFKVSIEPQVRHRALVMAVGSPEVAPPKQGDPNVVWYGPGMHRVDGLIRLKSNETLYLAPGSWVEGGILAEGTNITMCGRGVLSGAKWAWLKAPWKENGGRFAVFSGRNLTIRDVTFFSACNWTLIVQRCENATIDNVKIFGGRVLNDDGIDVVEARHTRIRDCFIRVQDDTITPKWWCEDLVVENCILWTDVANVFRIGYECIGASHPYRSLYFRHIDILHQTLLHRPVEHYWSNNAIFIQCGNEQRFSDIVFDDLRFDVIEPGDWLLAAKTFKVKDSWNQHKSAGYLDGVTLKNVHLPKLPDDKTMGVWLRTEDAQHPIKNIRFENVSGLGSRTILGEVQIVE